MVRYSASILYIALFAALTALGGLIRIPILPVPFTMQTFFVYLSGACLGGKRGAVSQIIFLMIGLIGVPVFALGGGPGYILQPTFGYLAAFPVAAAVTGYLLNKYGAEDGWIVWISAIGSGFIVVYFIGILYLWFSMKFILHKSISFYQAVFTGGIVFLPGAFLKVLLAMGIGRRLKRYFGDMKE